MTNILSIDSILFTFLGYPMSYLEFFGTVFNLACVWLVAKNKISTWPVGIVGVILYMFLFYQIQLYSDLFEQVYFLIASFYGWWMWSSLRNKRKKKEDRVKIAHTTSNEGIRWLLVIVVGTGLLTWFTSRVHVIFPLYFIEPASYPFLDAFTTIMSFVATILMAKKKVECWYLWILVDVIGIWLYFAKGVKFISLEYLIFLGLATKGLLDWKKEVGDGPRYRLLGNK